MFTCLWMCVLHSLDNSFILMPHKHGQWSEGFEILCFNKLKGPIDKWLSRRVHNTNAYKYRGSLDHFSINYRKDSQI